VLLDQATVMMGNLLYMPIKPTQAITVPKSCFYYKTEKIM